MARLFADAIARLQTRTPTPRVSTSLSDDQAYPQVCLWASQDYRVFNRFRRNRVYNRILEHVSAEQGRQYLAELGDDPELFAHLEEFRKNDAHGGPRVTDYGARIGKISPTTLRYIKVLRDLRNHFGSLDGMRIAEIGVGYGGQCRIINAMFKPASYTLIDIKPALMLTQRYLDNFVLHSPVSYTTMNELRPAEYDLFISNYAFTELPRWIQEPYLSKVIRSSKRGYLTYNEINPASFQSYRSEELVSMFGAEIFAEVPKTHPKNCILVWGHRPAG